jgi:DNA gyrase/topoisomerase IV subunit B
VPTGSPTDGGETQETGFSLRFRPDPDIFPDPRFDPARIRERLRQFAFLNSGVPITLTTEHGVERFEYSDGIRGYLGFLAEGRTVLHEPLIARSKAVGIEYELGLQWCEGNDPPLVESFANGSVTRDGGSHIEGLRTGISRAAGRYLRAHRPDVDFKSEDYREGLVGVVSVHLATPRYEFSTKSRLGSSEVRRPVQRAVEALLEGFFERNPAVVETIVLAAQSRIAAKEALQQSRRSMKKQS